MSEHNPITLNDFYVRLNERVSDYNAKLLLNTVKVGAGVREENDAPLNNEDAKSICLELIKKGGPAFQVGKTIYSELN